ncbi:MAG TPA: Gfo/Idh/MocA family oxidoreductase [Burkholderiales bacterium]|nr:Gfo/Idh/MocA family oxidoreductase [Burkholderiales bacterium]
MRRLRLGVAGLGRAFALMVPTLSRDPRVELVAAADLRPEALSRFKADFGGRTFSTVEELCQDPSVEAVYIATPHQFHAKHARIGFSYKKHALVEKPMALTLEECRAMIAAARKAGVHLIVGHSHSFDAPILHARKLIASGAMGRVRMITALNFTDYLYRPRRPEELDTRRGGGAVFNQAAHQVDIVRLLAGGRARSVRASTGNWDPSRPTEGAYSCFLNFENGVTATLAYSGYAHFDSDEFCDWIGELGQKKDPGRYGAARKSLQGDELSLKNARNYGGSEYNAIAGETLHQHFGLLIVSCERADLRPLPSGVMVYGDAEQKLDPLPAPNVPRAEVVDELYAAVVDGKAPLHDGEWALGTTEVCLAILRSAGEQKEIVL